MSIEEISQPDPAIFFQKFKQYFDEKFQAIDTPKRDARSVRELKNKLEAKELSKPGNVAQFEFCGKLEIALDNIKSAIIARHDTDAAIDAIQKAEQLVFDCKQKIKIADASKAGWSTVNRLDQSEHLSADQQKSVKAAEEEALLKISNNAKEGNENTSMAPIINILRIVIFFEVHVFSPFPPQYFVNSACVVVRRPTPYYV